MEAAAAAEEADHILKHGQVSAMLKLGFLPSPTSSPLSPATHRRSVPTQSPLASPPAPTPTTATLFDMIASEDKRGGFPNTGPRRRGRAALQARVSRFLLTGAYRACGPGDVHLTISSTEGAFRAKLRVHREILGWKSRFFADQIAKLGGKGREGRSGGAVKVEICECSVYDAEAYLEAVALMYCTPDDVRGVVAEESVAEVLALLEVSAALAFDAGVSACLDHLEAAAWTEEEEAQAVVVLEKLQPNYYAEASRVLQRVSFHPASSSSSSSPLLAAGLLPRILTALRRAKNDKARREMKELVAKLLTSDETPSHTMREETGAIYTHCRECIRCLQLHLSDAAEDQAPDRSGSGLMVAVAREADTLQWLAGILITRRSADHLVAIWADQKDLAELHSQTAPVYRTGISEVTARLLVGIGEGTVLVPRDTKSALLETWLEALYDDFGWMRKGERRRVVAEALGRTVLTLPMAQQQWILVRWAERFARQGDDCPDIRGAFQVWWRRAFVKRRHGGDMGIGAAAPESMPANGLHEQRQR